MATGWAEVPLPHDGLLTIAPIGLLVDLVSVVVDRQRGTRLRKTSAAVGVPLARRMGLVVTTHRLLTFRASGFPLLRRRELLVAMPASDIASVALPYSSGAPIRTVAIRLRAGPTVQLLVHKDFGELLVKWFSPVSPPSPGPGKTGGRRGRGTPGSSSPADTRP